MNSTRIMETGEFISNTIIKAKDLGIPKEINFNSKANSYEFSSGIKQLNLVAKFGQITIQKSFIFNDDYGIEQQIVVFNNSNKDFVFRVFEESVGQVDAAEHNVMGYFIDEDMEVVDSAPSETEKIIGDFSWYGFSKKYF